MREQTYIGLPEDQYGGLTDGERIVMDAQVFGLIPEGETCAGWSLGRLQMLSEQVVRAWLPYAGLPSRLPEYPRERHAHIYQEEIERARAASWNPELDDET